MVDHAGHEARRPLFDQCVGGLADDRQVRGKAVDFQCCIDTVHHRHLYVHKHSIVGLPSVLANGVNRLLAIFCETDFSSDFTQ